MLTVIKETYKERVDKYRKVDRAQLKNYLYTRDNYIKYSQVPSYLVYRNYDKLSTDFLAELLAERDLYESKFCCAEL